ncbi:MAG TPA: amidohydrolase [Usitatibacter sp.]
MASEVLIVNARVTTLDRALPEAESVAISGDRIAAVGSTIELVQRYPDAKRIDARGSRLVPGLNDSHMHIIRGGLNYNLELRWDGVPTLADAMAMLKDQAARTPPPQWVRVVGGFTEHQWPEKRMPTIAELNAVAPDTPVFILRLYDRALLNASALRAAGYTKDSQDPPGGQIERDGNGNPTGLLLAKPNALLLYATLAKGPKLSPQDQKNSTRLFMREMNRLGVTSVCDAGGGFQNYPDDYAIVEELAKDDELTVRIAYNLFTQNPKQEKEDFARWMRIAKPGQGSDFYRLNGAGEMLVFSAADFEDFRQPRPELGSSMEDELHQVTRLLVENRWPFRLHATYDESISRMLDAFERVNHEIPFDGLPWFFDHAETIGERNIDRVKALGGGIAIQHRMAYQGEDFVERYGTKAAEATPPVKKMLAAGVPVGAGTDATRVASYNPWVCIAWLVTGKTVGGLAITPAANCLDRETALRLYTEGSAWFSSDSGKKGQIKAGQLADMTLLSADLMRIPEGEISHITALLTMVGGRIVHGDGEFSSLAPPVPRASPDWSPVNTYGGYHRYQPLARDAACCAAPCTVHGHRHFAASNAKAPAEADGFWGALGCSCWV